MISFKQFLSESEQELLPFLLENCAPFLRESGLADNPAHAAFAVRGIHGMRSSRDSLWFTINNGVHEDRIPGYVISVRKDRKPVDFSDEQHEMLDDDFYYKFGWKVRSQGMFCFGESEEHDARHYGRVHMVFPMGEIKYVWSDYIMDLFGHLVGDKEFSKADMETYKDTGLQDALAGHGEIVIKCDRYLAIPISYKDDVRLLLKGQE